MKLQESLETRDSFSFVDELKNIIECLEDNDHNRGKTFPDRQKMGRLAVYKIAVQLLDGQDIQVSIEQFNIITGMFDETFKATLADPVDPPRGRYEYFTLDQLKLLQVVADIKTLYGKPAEAEKPEARLTLRDRIHQQATAAFEDPKNPYLAKPTGEAIGDGK